MNTIHQRSHNRSQMGSFFVFEPGFDIKGGVNNKSYLNGCVNSTRVPLFCPLAGKARLPFCLSSEEFSRLFSTLNLAFVRSFQSHPWCNGSKDWLYSVICGCLCFVPCYFYLLLLELDLHWRYWWNMLPYMPIRVGRFDEWLSPFSVFFYFWAIVEVICHFILLIWCPASENSFNSIPEPRNWHLLYIYLFILSNLTCSLLSLLGWYSPRADSADVSDPLQF